MAGRDWFLKGPGGVRSGELYVCHEGRREKVLAVGLYRKAPSGVKEGFLKKLIECIPVFSSGRVRGN